MWRQSSAPHLFKSPVPIANIASWRNRPMRRQLQPSGVDRIAVSPEQVDNPTLNIGFDFAGTCGNPPQFQRSARGAGDTPPEQLSTIRRFYECPDVAFLSIAEVFDRFHTQR